MVVVADGKRVWLWRSPLKMLVTPAGGRGEKEQIRRTIAKSDYQVNMTDVCIFKNTAVSRS